jgi:D-citramalate synthase
MKRPETNFAKKIQVLDTTLRDGEQTPGVVFKPAVKASLAKELKRFGADIIEAGSAINGKSEKEAIRLVCEALGDNKCVSSFARIRNEDVDAVVEAGAGRISLVFPASNLHIEKKLRFRPDDIEFHNKALAVILKSAEYALGKGLTVELLAEDASRADPDFLKLVSLRAQEIGVECFCVCDTLGVFTPSEAYELFRYLKDGGPEHLSFHGHNDHGLSTANTLEALRAGADRFHGTINGLGERTGNCPIEQVALTLQTNHGIHTVNLTMAQEISAIVAAASRLQPPKNLPVVGEFAFRHDAGIHHDGLGKSWEMYSPYDPAIVGQKHRLSLGKLSGKGSIKMKLAELGVELDEDKLPEVLKVVRQMEEEDGYVVSDADFLLLVEKAKSSGIHEKLVLDEMQVSTGNKNTPTAFVWLRVNGEQERRRGSAEGDGPVDAAIKAVNDALGNQQAKLVEYHVDAITGGSDAPIRVDVKVEMNGKAVQSSAKGNDIVTTSVEAYLKAVRYLL